MNGEIFCTGGVINLENGESIRDLTLQGVPNDKLFVIEFVGINAFAQPDQTIFVALQVHTSSRQGIYPIVTVGNSPYSDPEYPVRIFGSQQVKLYADPNSELIITFARENDSGNARAFVDLSGRLITPREGGSIRPPQNVQIT